VLLKRFGKITFVKWIE